MPCGPSEVWNPRRISLASVGDATLGTSPRFILRHGNGVNPDLATDRDTQDGIDHEVLRTFAARLGQVRDHNLHEPLRHVPRHGRQDDQSGMNVDIAGEPPEIICVLRDNDAVFSDGSLAHDVVGIAQSIAITWMDRIVQTVLVEMPTEWGRDALVDKKPHLGDRRRGGTGRPTCGWVRA
jgi:hypothetical protein